jgi:predicted Zn-dependent peptidase
MYEQNTDKVKSEIFKVINDFQNNQISDAQLEKAKKMLERNTLYEREAVSNVASEIGYSTLLTGDWNFYNNYLSEVNKVTTKDIQQVAKKYLNSKNAIISIITPKNSNSEIPTQVFNKQEETATLKLVPDKYYVPMHHNAISEESSADKKKFNLDNGATLITEEHKNNEIIAITINVKGGNYTDKIRGLSSVLAAAMTDGTEKYSKNDLAQIMDEYGIKIAISANTEYLTLQMQCTKQDLPLAKDVLNQIVNKATLRAEDIATEKNDILYDIRQSRDKAINVAFEEMSSALWKNTPYDKTGKLLEKTIPTITSTDVKDKYLSLFNPENIVVAVSGDVSSQDVIDLFSDVFKKNSSEVVNYDKYKNLFKALEENKTIEKYQGNESAWIVMAWETDGLRDKKDRVTLRVIDAILGSGMSSRLFTEVRAQKGLAYAVASTVPTNVNKGTFIIYIGTDPNKVDYAEKAIMVEVHRLMNEFVTDKELQDAKNKLKGEAILSQELNIEKTNAMAVSETVGNGYDYYYDNFNKLVDSVTLTDVMEVANKYFSKKYVVSKVLPKK